MVAFLGAALAFAGIAPRYTLAGLAANSEVIVEGRVTRTWSAWDSNHKYIWTHYELQVADVLKGAALAAVVVSEPGGALDGIHQLFSGAVPYSIGDHVVLFLYRTPIGYLRTRGGPQGKIVVQSRASLAAFKLRVRGFLKAEVH